MLLRHALHSGRNYCPRCFRRKFGYKERPHAHVWKMTKRCARLSKRGAQWNLCTFRELTV
eukprot:5933838-Pyramimonas_sp.AAC.1